MGATLLLETVLYAGGMGPVLDPPRCRGEIHSAAG
jgi:hypothetical protein